MAMDADKLRDLWNSRTPEDRSDWIWKAGFTKEAARKYRDMMWAMLPEYVRETLIDQES